MSKESAIEFFKKVNEDKALREKLTQDERFGDNPIEAAMDLAAKAGYAFNAEEFYLAWNELPDSELTENELSQVAGGSAISILEAAMLQRESIHRAFESQRAAMQEAIKAQRDAAMSQIAAGRNMRG